MIDAGSMTETTEQPAPAKATGGFPPFDTTTFANQIFWLVISMAVLFVVLWRFAGPRIRQTITERRTMIQNELAKAQEDRQAAERATQAYQAPLLQARERARELNNQTRERAAQAVKRAEADADAKADQATAEAEARLAQVRAEAKGHIAAAAQAAAADIVARLTGEQVSADDAAAAVSAVQKG